MRIVALSDQHGHLPEVPPCDLLLVGGDVCPDHVDGVFAGEDPGRQQAWFEAHARPWLTNAPAAHKILTWGNHDWCGQACRLDEPPPPPASSPALQIVVDALIRVPTATTGRSLSVWATPWSREFGRWAFMKSPAELTALYSGIPEGIDILVSHQPPLGYGDRYNHPGSGDVEHLGSPELLAAIARVRPGLVVCGHLHAGYGGFVYDGIPIWNVSVVNDDYHLVRPATVIDVADW